LWEIGDGCIHLAAELCKSSKELASKVPPTFPFLAEGLKHRDFPQHVVFHESLCKRLMDIARGLEKKQFKRHLEVFLEVDSTIVQTLNR
jgi:hypothetical protein